MNEPGCIVDISYVNEEGKLENLVQSVSYGEYMAIKAILNINTQNHTKIVDNELKKEEHAKLY